MKLKVTKEWIEACAINLANLQNIDPEMTKEQFWNTFSENSRDTMRMEASACLIGSLDYMKEQGVIEYIEPDWRELE